MPTASETMTQKLVDDFAVIGKALLGFQAHLKEYEGAGSEDGIEKLQGAYDRIKPQIDKFAVQMKQAPPTYPGETDYKARRKDVTTLLAFVAKSAKVVAEEKKAPKEVTVEAVSSAKSELLRNDKKLAQALAMVARGEKGRAGPKEVKEKFSHIHIGGNAQENLLFRPGSKLVLGVLDFHMQKDLSESKKEEIKKVATRSGGTITLKIEAGKISLVKK